MKVRLLTIFLLIPFLLTAQDWHKEQLGTGLGNCGPACAAMLIERSGIPITVQQAREIIGETGSPMNDGTGRLDGATTLFHLKKILNYYNILWKLIPDISLYSTDEYAGGAFICLLDMAAVNDRPYSYEGGHYIVIFGIRGEYYEVADPLTSELQLYKVEEVNNSQRGELIYVY